MKETLSTILQFKNGKKRPKEEGDIPVYGGNGVLGYTNKNNYENCVVIGRVGAYCGSVYLERDTCWVSDNAIAALAKDDTDIVYAYYLLKSQRLNERRIGTSQPLLTQEILNKIEVDILPYETQVRVGRFLGRFDEKISLNERINQNLLQQAQALYRSWFVSFDQNSGQQPEEWKTCKIGDLTALVSRGITPKYDDESDQIVINQKCVRNNLIDLSLARRHKPKVINEKWLQHGDLLINSTGEGTLGRTAQVWFLPERMTVDSHVTIVRPSRDDLKYYIGLWGITHEREIEALHTGSTGQTELPRDRVKEMQIPLPDSDSLKRFDAAIKPITSMITDNLEENERLSIMRDNLLPRIIAGKLDVSDVDF